MKIDKDKYFKIFFETILKKTFKWIIDKNLNLESVNKNSLNNRLMQSLCYQITNYKEIDRLIINSKLNKKLIYLNKKKIIDSKLEIDSDNGHVKLKFSFIIKKIIKYIFLNFKIIFLILKGLVLFENLKKKNYIILYASIGRHLNTIDNELFKKKILEFLKKFGKNNFLVNINIKNNHKMKLNFQASPIDYLIIKNLSLKQRLFLLKKTFQEIFYFLRLFIEEPIFLLISEELPYNKILLLFDREKIIKKIVYTTGTANHLNQPLWSFGINKNFKTILYWESMGYVYNYYFKKEPKFIPLFKKLIVCDQHIIWDNNQKEMQKYLKNTEFKKINYHSFFYKKLIKKNKNISIVIFDINVNKININGIEVENLHSMNCIKTFYKDIFEVINQIKKKNKINICINVKRKNKDRGDEIYSLIRRYKKKFDYINILQTDYDMVDLLNKNNLSITYPFTTPSFLDSSIFNKKSIYYDPSQKLLLKKKNKNIFFIGNKNLLKLRIKKIINEI